LPSPRLGGAKVNNLFFSRKYFLTFLQKKIFFAYLSLTPYSKNGRAKVHNLFSSCKFILEKNGTFFESSLDKPIGRSIAHKIIQPHKAHVCIFTIFMLLSHGI
jgi:hypothetical protein